MQKRTSFVKSFGMKYPNCEEKKHKKIWLKRNMKKWNSWPPMRSEPEREHKRTSDEPVSWAASIILNKEKKKRETNDKKEKEMDKHKKWKIPEYGNSFFLTTAPNIKETNT